MEASLLILSGGLDSTVSATLAAEQTAPQCALFFDYGQRAVAPERQAATLIAARLGVPLEVVALPWLSRLGQSALTDATMDLPDLDATQLDDAAATADSARQVWVPNRNGVFLNVAAAFAESLDARLLVTGFNAEEAETFPDNSQDFVKVAGEFFRYATRNGVRVVSFTQEWNKQQIVQQGLELDIPFHRLWSCYEAGPKQCGRCESCLRSIRAYQAAGIWQQMQECFDHADPIH